MFENFSFWVAFALCFIGYMIYRFGMISRGLKKMEMEATGGIIAFSSFPLVFFMVGGKALLVLILMFWIVITPITEVIVPRIFKKLLSM